MSFLEIGTADLRVAISPIGAALARVWFGGSDQSLVLGLDMPEQYRFAPAAMGVIVGPIAGRISGARVHLDGKTYDMPANTPPDCLHSGPDGVQNAQWHVDAITANEVTLSTDLQSGDCGLPGNRRLTAHYKVDAANLTLTLTSRSDADTFVNATNHAYWALDDRGDLTAHKLQVFSDRYVETGPDLIPTGALLPTAGSDRDFSDPRCPVDGPPLDGTFVLNGPRAVSLMSSASGVHLHVSTNQPGVVLYTGENMPVLPAPSQTPAIGPFSGIAIEAQGLPDAPNHPHFPSILLRGGEERHQVTTYSFTQTDT